MTKTEVAVYCGRRQDDAGCQWLDRRQADAYPVIRPQAVTQTAADEAARQVMMDALRSRARYAALGQGRVRELQLVSAQITRLAAHSIILTMTKVWRKERLAS